MLDRFKKIKNRTKFYSILGQLTAKEPLSIKNNWFNMRFCSVPKPYIEISEKTISDFIDFEKEHEKETIALEKRLINKYFGL